MIETNQSPTPEFIGSWVDGGWRRDGESYVVVNPATGQPLASVARADPGLVDRATAAAGRAYRTHRRVTRAERADWCLSVAQVLRARAEALALELSEEHGKPLAEARGEVAFAIDGFEVAAREALTLGGDLPEVRDPHKRVLVRREPLGTWAVLTPFNFPFNIPVEYLGPAIASGNAVVWKPAPSTSRIAVRLMEAILESAVPEGIVQLVLTDDVEVARHLVTRPDVVAVGFTGGSAAGADIARRAWDKHLLLELGGNGPVVVLDDADIEKVAPAIASSAFWNAGQVCSAAGRIVASRGVADQLAEVLAAEAAAWVVGDPMAPETRVGPLHQASAVERVERHVQDAVAKGGAVLVGGHAPESAVTGNFFTPTVIKGAPETSVGFTEETFGPLAAVTMFESDEAVLNAANRSGFGLVGALYTSRLDRALTVAERIDCGMVVVNDTSNYWEHNLPFGGAPGKASGRGRLGGRYALAEFTQARAICLDVRP